MGLYVAKEISQAVLWDGSVATYTKGDGSMELHVLSRNLSICPGCSGLATAGEFGLPSDCDLHTVRGANSLMTLEYIGLRAAVSESLHTGIYP